MDNTEDIFRVDGCLLIKGHIEVSSLVKYIREFTNSAVMDTNLARMAKVSFAIGHPEDVKKLKEKYTDDARAEARERYKDDHLSDEAIEWIACGEQGLSSVTAFHVGLGTREGRYNADTFAEHHPHDFDDFNRISKLVRDVPEVREGFPKLRRLSPEWQEIIDRFEELERALEDLNTNGERGYTLKDLLKRSSNPNP